MMDSGVMQPLLQQQQQQQLPQQQQQQQQHHHHTEQQEQQQQQLHQQQHQQHSSQPNDNIDDITQQLMILVRETQDTDHMVQSNRDIHQEFVLQLQTRGRLKNSISYAEQTSHHVDTLQLAQTKATLARVDALLKHRLADLDQVRRQLLNSHWSIFERLLRIQNKILYEYLPRWQHEQQLSNNGELVETIKLDIIQSWIEKIVDTIWRIKNQIKGIQLTLTDRPNIMVAVENFESLVIHINKALENLILNSFVVEKQPPQVMKTNTRFTATVRFLCGNRLNVQMINPTVKAIILSEQNARSVIKYHKQLIDESWSSFEFQWPNYFTSHQSQQPTNSLMATQSLDSSQISSVPQATLQMNGQMNSQQVVPNYNIQTADSAPSASQMLGAPNQSVDQPMTVIEQSPPTQQFFHHQTTLSAQHQHHQANPTTSLSNMTIQQQYGSITEIGYNPDVPISSKDFECSGEILNSSNVLEYNEASGHMISHFRNMQLKKIKRTEKKGTESVMDEKFILLFFTEFRLADDSFWPYSVNTTSNLRIKRVDLLFHILAFSMPVVVTVHGNQEPHAWATVTWHNAFAVPDDVLYKVPDRVPWRDLGRVLSEKFRSSVGRGLTEQNLKYLASKVYRRRVDNDDVMITWNQFSKEPLSDRSFTFWEWFHSILKLTKDHLDLLWRAERIYGFIGKKGCVDLLLGSDYNKPCPAGTFLLRFSETELGGITIACVSNSSELYPHPNDHVQISQRSSPTNASSNVVMHLQPFVVKCLSTRSLADRVRDLKDLVYLYPNIPKDEAFESYYSPINNTQPESHESYVGTILMTTLAVNYPGNSSTGAQTESSVTPNSLSQNSPETYYHDSIMQFNNQMDTNFDYETFGSGGERVNYTIQ